MQAQETNIGQFQLIGDVTGFKNGTEVYFFKDNKQQDLAKIKNGRFEFKGEISEPERILIQFGRTVLYKQVWIEEGTVFIKANKKDISAAIITGSKTQKEEDLLNERLSPLENKLDSIENSVNPKSSKEKLELAQKEYEKVEAQEKLIFQDFIKEYPESYVSAGLINTYKTTWGKDETQNLFNFLAENLQNSEAGKRIAQYLQKSKDLNIGDHFEDFEMENPNGIKERLSENLGKITMLEFWASWCAPCREYNPDLVKIYKKYQDKGFEIFAVSLDVNRNMWKNAIKKDKLTWTQVSDLEKDNLATQIYNISMIPYNILIDENGIIIGKNVEIKELDKTLKSLLE